jgi:hypothetical protein
MERNFISSRQQAGIEAAKAAGISEGRKPSGRPGASVDSRWQSPAEIARELNISRQSVYQPVALTRPTTAHITSVVEGQPESRPSVAWVSAYQSSRVKGLPQIVPVPNPAQRLLQEI